MNKLEEYQSIYWLGQSPHCLQQWYIKQPIQYNNISTRLCAVLTVSLRQRYYILYKYTHTDM